MKLPLQVTTERDLFAKTDDILDKPLFMGHIADVHSMRIGFLVPLVCFVCVALYGVFWQKLEAKDSLL